jgi:hypothetical protein
LPFFIELLSNLDLNQSSWPGENAPQEVLPDNIKQAILTIQNSIDETQKLPEICMEVLDDFLNPNPLQQI